MWPASLQDLLRLRRRLWLRRAGRGERGLLGTRRASSRAAPPARPPARPRSRSRTQSHEGRRYSRATIEERLLAQWRDFSMEGRPLPPRRRRDSGLVGYGTWSDGLVGEARARTRELLASERSASGLQIFFLDGGPLYTRTTAMNRWWPQVPCFVFCLFHSERIAEDTELVATCPRCICRSI